MSSQLIQSKAYYYVSSDLYGSNFLLCDGLGAESPSTLFFRLGIGIFSSDNWQIFYQDPIFLIRNYDYGAEYQLGIAEDSPTLPALLPASGELTQQWNMTLWDDGTYRLANMWLGSEQMLGVSTKDNETIPVMNAAQNGSRWSFAINANVNTNVTDAMLQPVLLQAAPSSTSASSSLSTSSSTVSSSTPAGTTVIATTSTAGSVSSSSSSGSSSSSSSSSSPASSQFIKSRSISGGAITGIVMAIVAAALVVFGLLFLVWRRRRQQRQGTLTDQALTDQAALAPQHREPMSTTVHELDTRPPPSEIGLSDRWERMRSRAVEMAG